jgi:hypothetical protein
LRLLLLISLAVGLGSGCRVVSDENGAGENTEPGRTSPFRTADSLIQVGRQDQAVRELRELWRNMESPENLRDDFLWRFTGCYHGRGLPVRCLEVLDSLSRAGWGDLSGWKVSVMELNMMGNSALPLAAGNRLLEAWLRRDSLETLPPGVTPSPEGPAERTVRVIMAGGGTLTPAQITSAAQDAQLFPSTLAPRVREELRLAADCPDQWWDNALKLLDPGLSTPEGAGLHAARMKAMGAGGPEEWAGMLDRPGMQVIAAEMMASKYPDRADWRVADILYENGMGSLADRIASSRGGEFAQGVEMARLRALGRHSELLTLCGSLGPEASEQLRGRAALFRARALRGLNRTSEAWAAYAEFARLYPRHPVASEAGYLAGVYYDCEQQWGPGADAYLAGLRAYPDFEADERGHWRGGFCLYMNGRGATGDSLWAAATELWPCGYWRDEMLFWRARYADRRGDEDREESLLVQVAREHPWEYYGMLAAQRLGIPSPLELTVFSPVLADSPETCLALELFGRGYGTLAVEMLASGPGDPALRAASLGILGQHGAGIGLMRSWDTELREAGRGMLPDSMLGWYFPSPYHQDVARAVEGLSVEPFWIEGISRDESYFNRFARSGAGAAGLIQLMPGTAGDVARWYGLPRLSGDDFFTPEYSLRYGSMYVDRQMNSFGHSPLFLAAYNAGPGNASRWVAAQGWDPDDPEMFIEQITFRETRLYVKNVQRSVWIYERIRR